MNKPQPMPVPLTTTPSPAMPTSGPPGTCLLFGDPHIMTFDHKRVDFYTPGEYWVVKSATVSIQARYKPTHITSGLSVTKEIAFGGAFMKGHVLRVSSMTATYDGQSIISGFPSSFSNEIVQIQYNSMGG